MSRYKMSENSFFRSFARIRGRYWKETSTTIKQNPDQRQVASTQCRCAKYQYLSQNNKTTVQHITLCLKVLGGSHAMQRCVTTPLLHTTSHDHVENVYNLSMNHRNTCFRRSPYRWFQTWMHMKRRPRFSSRQETAKINSASITTQKCTHFFGCTYIPHRHPSPRWDFPHLFSPWLRGYILAAPRTRVNVARPE